MMGHTLNEHFWKKKSRYISGDRGENGMMKLIAHSVFIVQATLQLWLSAFFHTTPANYSTFAAP